MNTRNQSHTSDEVGPQGDFSEGSRHMKRKCPDGQENQQDYRRCDETTPIRISLELPKSTTLSL
jgi:hypothetical protein